DLAADFETFADVLGQVLAGDERILRSFLAAIRGYSGQKVVPVRVSVQTPDQRHVLPPLEVDLGVRRRFCLLRLRGEPCGTHRGETDRDCCSWARLQGCSCGAVSAPRTENEGRADSLPDMDSRFVRP